MHSKSLKTKMIAMFLVAFVCLNAGGAVCVAYCQSIGKPVTAGSDHCPLKKKGNHCDPSQQERSSETAASLSSNKLDCCPMTLSFIAAPLEKRAFAFETAPVPALIDEKARSPVFVRNTAQTTIPAYRGPPMDRRPDRLKRCVIRI